MAENPFLIKIYDKNLNFKGFIGDPVQLTVTPRYNLVGTGVLELELDHHAIPYLMAGGARLVILLRGAFLMSAKVTRRTAEGPFNAGVMKIAFRDDYRLLYQILGYPVPGAALTAQTSEYAVYTGNAETILKNAVTENMVTRLGLPVTVAANLNRGATVPDGVSLRFHPLHERLFPAIEKAGLGVTFQQSGSSIVCDVFTPPVFARTLSEETGVIASWTWTDEDPTATHVVAGGEGEGTLRVFRDVRDTVLEAEHNDVVEVFRDARDADTAAIVISRAQEELDDGYQRSGFAIHLSETEHFQYGKDGLVVGAMVTIDLGFATRTDVLREVTLNYTRDEGYVATPIVGEIRDNPDRTIAKFLAQLKKGITDLKVSK